MEIHFSDTELRTIFTASCIESAAREAGCSASEMYRRMNAVGLIDNYIWKFYDSLHTQSRAYVVEDVMTALANWEKRKGLAND